MGGGGVIKLTLFLLPANDAHLIQPLYISVFKTFKLMLKRCVSDFMLKGTNVIITKKYAMSIGSKFWRGGLLATNRNIVSGFQSDFLLPLCFPEMQRRLKYFKDGSISASALNPTLTRCYETVQMELLLFLP